VAASVLWFAIEPVRLAEATEAFLTECDLSRSTGRVYALTLARLEAGLGSA